MSRDHGFVALKQLGHLLEREPEGLPSIPPRISPTPLPSFELRPYPFQVKILDKLRAERERHRRHRDLVVAATGTGKTIVTASGELFVVGEEPEEGRHVFASVQALSHVALDRIPPDSFDVVIVDEFRHAEAPPTAASSSTSSRASCWASCVSGRSA